MNKKERKSEEGIAFSEKAIDYQFYEKRARCLRSGTLLNWLNGWVPNKNYSSKEAVGGNCGEARLVAAGNG